MPVPSRRVLVAVDGPSGSGKSSVSREVARRAGLSYLDTGAMYRGFCWAALRDGVDVGDSHASAAVARGAVVFVSTDPDVDRVVVDGVDVTTDIRGADVTAAVSAFASHPPVREVLRLRQRAVMDAAATGCIAEGRDITTVVAPDADVRILLTADADARVRRRAEQLGDAAADGADGVDRVDAVRDAVLGRDEVDSRVTSFTTAADGVLHLDSSGLDLEQTVAVVLDLVRQAQEGPGAEAPESVDVTGADGSTARLRPPRGATAGSDRGLPRGRVAVSVPAPRAPGRWWGRIVGHVVAHVLWRTDVRGLENLGTGPVLLAVNHVSVLDGPLVYSSNRRSVHFLVKKEMFRGFFGWVLRQVGQIPVDRTGGDRAALSAAVAVLREGGAAGIFPEGSRGRGDVAAVRTGIAWIALQSGAPVVPVAVLGTRRTGERAGGLPRLRRRLHVVHGEPFRLERPAGVPGKQALALAAEEVRVRLGEHVRHAVALTGEPLPDDPGRTGTTSPDPSTGTPGSTPSSTSSTDPGQAGRTP